MSSEKRGPSVLPRIAVCAGLGFALAALLPLLTGAQSPDPTDYELRLLPRYCQVHASVALDRTEAEKTEYKRWASILGQGYGHTHHYCWGLILMNRSHRSRDKVSREYLIDRAIGEFDYVIKYAESNFALLPEIRVRKGMLLRTLGKNVEAAPEYIKAIRLNPKYAPAYSALSDYYLDLNKAAEARQVLEEGLREVPDSEALRKKLARLRAIDGN